MKKKIFSIVVWTVLLALTGTGRADWVLEEFDGDFPARPVTLSFRHSKVRVEGLLGTTWFLLDLGKGEGFLVDEKAGRYAGGTMEEIRDRALECLLAE